MRDMFEDNDLEDDSLYDEEDIYTCNSCGEEFTSGTDPEECPNCNTKFDQ
jgi:rubrerythrin